MSQEIERKRKGKAHMDREVGPTLEERYQKPFKLLGLSSSAEEQQQSMVIMPKPVSRSILDSAEVQSSREAPKSIERPSKPPSLVPTHKPATRRSNIDLKNQCKAASPLMPANPAVSTMDMRSLHTKAFPAGNTDTASNMLSVNSEALAEFEYRLT